MNIRVRFWCFYIGSYKFALEVIFSELCNNPSPCKVSMVLSGDLVAPLTVSAAPEVCPTGSPRQGSLALGYSTVLVIPSRNGQLCRMEWEERVPNPHRSHDVTNQSMRCALPNLTRIKRRPGLAYASTHESALLQAENTRRLTPKALRTGAVCSPRKRGVR